jgi:sarcosine oxidase, subunit alpha
MNRLALPDSGLLIDRSTELRFTFDGRTQYAHPGDTIASALIANGRHLISRSFKYHRPRGVLTMTGNDVNAMVQVGDEPNVRGDAHLVKDGMTVKSVNRYGSLDFDVMAGLGAFSRFLPVGFYYKTFFRPNGSWKLFERPIREVAGLGALEKDATPEYFDKAYLFADVMVVGAGPAGMEAALKAAAAGKDVLLVDEGQQLGGSLLYGRLGGSRAAANDKRTSLAQQITDNSQIEVLIGATCSGLFTDGWAAVIKGNRLYKVRTKEIVLATGGYEQPIVFANNDRPGVMFADAAQRLIRLYGVKPGERAVIATSNIHGYEAALDCLEAGIEVAAVLDLTDGTAETDALAARHGLKVLKRHAPVNTKGGKHLVAVMAGPIGADGDAAATQHFEADLLLMSVGYTPALNLASHAGAKIGYDPAIHMHRATQLPAGLTLAGFAAGEGAAGVNHPYPIFTSGKGKNFIDFDEDLSVKDIVHSIADGYDDIQLIKRYTTVGIGPSQGRHSNLNTIRVAAKMRGRPIEAIGTTTFRPPLIPEKFGHMAGRAFDPVRQTAMHVQHEALGAQFMAAGAWLRPAYYGPEAKANDAIMGEAMAVRTGVGIIDVGTLGKLEVRGPDAAAFLERMYTWTYAKQPVGKCKYLLMTDQAGIVTDDGVAARLHDMHFYCTATTSGVDSVYRQMTFWNTQWKMDVDITNVTAGKAAVNIAGPKARVVMQALASDIDFSKEAFPYLAVREGHLAGIPVRIMRIGFVGELGYEIHCPNRHGAALWDALMNAGKSHGICPFGVEAQRVLRLEKGHIIVGQDTDGLTNPFEGAMDWAVGMKKPFFIGQRSLKVMQKRPMPKKLTGFTLVEDGAPQPKENHLIIDGNDIIGRITSVVRSPTLEKVVGLCFLPPGKSEIGTHFDIRVDGRMVKAEVIAFPFYDPESKRQEL